MTKYLINRLIRGFFSIVVVVCIVMLLIYTLVDRNQIFVLDPQFSKKTSNTREIYKMQQWEKYGYIDYVSFDEYLEQLKKEGTITDEIYKAAVKIGKTAADDSATTKEYVEKFTELYESKGYKVERKDAVRKGKGDDKQRLYAYSDVPIFTRAWNYFSGIFSIDNIHYVKEDIDNRGISFTLFDPVYGGDKFSPAIMGNGTKHKYLLYFNDEFPFIHQNLVTINLGTSYVEDKGKDVFQTMTATQGSQKTSLVTYPTKHQEVSADDLHTATYVAGSLANDKTGVTSKRFVDDYTNVALAKDGLSKIGYSFVIGIISVIMSYLLAIPLGTMMALKKDKFVDKLGTFYIIFIIAVPSLAYIFMFKAIGQATGLPVTFDSVNPTWKMYVLPIVSLALPSVAGLMKWLRRYMIDQMNSDYVKFARSNGLSEREIFSKHILKNAVIPIVHGIPGSVLGALVGAIITESVYVVPGTGNMLTNAINTYDNSVIVGVTLFYALLSVVSIIFGDLLMSMVDPRINFSSKAR